MKNEAVNETTTVAKSRKDHVEIQTQILPMSQEFKEEPGVSDATKKHSEEFISTPVKEELKCQKRRLSFQAMEESSGSEFTPSPSPEVERRRLKVTTLSSSSEDIKTESADSSADDEDFIRKQIMGMGDELEKSLSDDENKDYLEKKEVLKVQLDNASVKPKSPSQEDSTHNEGSIARTDVLKKDAAPTQGAPETMPRTTFKKAIPVMRQRQSTDEEIESITESLSKGSSSVQASSFTPASSPTSASSLEEDSDSSPRHRKIVGDKQCRKGKHRQPNQPLPTIDDSSEEEKMKEEGKSRKEMNELIIHGQPPPSNENVSSTDDLRQISEIDETIKTSGSVYSTTMESEPDPWCVQRGHKPSPTVIPYTPSDSLKEDEILSKSLKTAEDAYEEIIQKTKYIPGESPPDIEPLYGGMAIEDYLYESLVEDPEIMIGQPEAAEPNINTASEPVKKLRSPEEVYEEMMEKKKELMLIEQEFQQAQTAMESSPSEPPSIAETCVVIMPSEQTSPTGQTHPLIGSETTNEVLVKKKKRPAPPRPSEPPKRQEVTVISRVNSGSRGFVRPMVPQDPTLRKALFPIPDLKITQCSSGEEEDDSLADEYGVGVSSDITPSDDSETKIDPSVSPPLSETNDMEPICVLCEIPEPKPIPTPISAPELTTTPSPVSPVSPPTSPATPDSSLASNATSSSSFLAQTPLSSDSTPLSTPTLPTSIVTQSPPEIVPSTSMVETRSLSETSVSYPTTVIVTIPDVVSDPSNAQTAVIQVTASLTETPTQAPVETPQPVVVEMPDLVSSPSQIPIKTTSAIQVSAPSSEPAVVSAVPMSTATLVTGSVPVTISASDHVVSATVTLTSGPAPVIIQMPDLVSTTSPIAAQPPLPVSALITTSAQAKPNVVHSASIQPAMTSVVSAATAQTSATTVRKKIPPPPPPRSTSVSITEPSTELPPVRTIQHVSPTVTAAITGTETIGQQMQSVAVDIQPRMEDMHPDDIAVPQVVTPTRQGHVVIIVPSTEVSRLGQIPQDRTWSSEPQSQIASQPVIASVSSYPAAASDTSSTIKDSLSMKASMVQVASAPPLPPKPATRSVIVDAVEIPVTNIPQPRAATLPRPNIYPKLSDSSMPTTSMKPPPPIPPKPILIPVGLVFSHKPGESVKPPPSVVPKAATLPRTKEPPNALSLSLTRPVESKYGVTSPKSPLSPRHAKSLKTYVVITLPSEPGSPTEVITVQAPIRQGSIQSANVSGVRSTPSEQKTPTDSLSAQAIERIASIPNERPPIPITPPVTLEHTKPSEIDDKVQDRRDAPLSIIKPPPSVDDNIIMPSDQDTPIQVRSVPSLIKKPYVPVTVQEQSIQPVSLPITMYDNTVSSDQQVFDQALNIEATARLQSVQSVTEHTEDTAILEEVSVPDHLAQIPKVPMQQQTLIETVAIPIHPMIYSHALSSQDQTASESAAGQQEHMLVEVLTHYPKQEPLPAGFSETNSIAELPSVPQTFLPVDVSRQVSIQQPYWTPEVMTLPKSQAKDFKTGVVVEVPGQSPALTAQTDKGILPPEVSRVTPVTPVAKFTTPVIAEVTPYVTTEIQQFAVQPVVPMVYGTVTSSYMTHSTPPLLVKPLQPEPIDSNTEAVVSASEPSSIIQPQAVAAVPVGVTTTEETSSRTSVSSIAKPPYTKNEIYIYPSEYEIPTQVVTMDAFAATRRESITMQQPLPFNVINLPAEKDVPADAYAAQVPYWEGSFPSSEQAQVLTYSSEHDHPLEIITTEAYTRRTSMPTAQEIPKSVSVAPVTITKIQQESIESQEIRGPEKVVSSMSHMYSSSFSTSGPPPEILPSLVTQVVTTEVQRTTVSVVHERFPQSSSPSVAITIKPDAGTVQPLQKQNGKIIYPGDVIDLRTMKVGTTMTEQGMDLTPPESFRQTPSETSGRQITAVQPEIVNLSAEVTPATTLSVVTDSITIVTCTATIASYSNTPAEKPLDLQGPVTSMPLPLTTYKPFEPLAQIVYRPVNAQPVVSAAASSTQDIPINLSFGALVSTDGKKAATLDKTAPSSEGSVLSLETTGAMDLSNYRPVRAMVALSGANQGIVTTVIEDDVTPVDLTGGRRAVCCDVIYKLPFARSCRTQPPVTSQPENRFGYRDDHYQYDNSGLYGIKGINGVKASLSETNLTEAGLISYDPKNDNDYLRQSTDGAIDLTATKLSAGEYGALSFILAWHLVNTF